ncbi:MAG: hypothetical protein H0U42_08770 [Thermoleophilaceae bacterium]|nr:hypothetical protein [Thermoleophilaceae bacterium]
MLLTAVGPAGAVIHEDSKRWDCRTMGDLECGPGLARYCDRTGIRYCNTARACRRIANRPHPLPGRRLAWSCEIQ